MTWPPTLHRQVIFNNWMIHYQRVYNPHIKIGNDIEAWQGIYHNIIKSVIHGQPPIFWCSPAAAPTGAVQRKFKFMRNVYLWSKWQGGAQQPAAGRLVSVDAGPRHGEVSQVITISIQQSQMKESNWSFLSSFHKIKTQRVFNQHLKRARIQKL